jgi:hypothetical protein
MNNGYFNPSHSENNDELFQAIAIILNHQQHESTAIALG